MDTEIQRQIDVLEIGGVPREDIRRAIIERHGIDPYPEVRKSPSKLCSEFRRRRLRAICYNLKASGMNNGEIARHLNSKNIRTPGGYKWNAQRVYHCLKAARNQFLRDEASRAIQKRDQKAVLVINKMHAQGCSISSIKAHMRISGIPCFDLKPWTNRKIEKVLGLRN